MSEQPGRRRQRRPAGRAEPDAASASRRAGVRRAAVAVLVAADSSGRFADEVLPGEREQLEERDRHLLQEITYGALRHRDTLDALLDFYLKLPTARQKPAVRWALRVGAYQLVYLGRIPAHAAVNQTLEGLKAIPGTGAGEVGFANAVLHKLSESVRKKSTEEPVDRDDPTILPIRLGHCHFSRPVLPLIRLDPVGHLALKFSQPRWLVGRWLERHGDEETRLLLAAQNRIPATTARVTRLAPSREAVLEVLALEGVGARPSPRQPSIFLESAAGLERSQAFARGWIQVQDETAMEIGAVLSPPPGARVLDLCAAPGGKALQLLEQVGPEGHLVAADRTEEKLAILRQNLARAGSNFSTVLLPEDPEKVDLGEKFTHILLDAPCSNTGVLARRAEARWRATPRSLESLADLQRRLLEAAIRHLAPGGRLVYATCSIEPEENENAIANVFERHADLTERETKLFLPHRSQADGGFFSLLLRSRLPSRE